MRNKLYRNIIITFVSTIDAEIEMEHNINIYSLDSLSEVTCSLVSSELIFLQKSRGDLAFYVETNFQRLSGIVENEMHGHFIYMPYLAKEIIQLICIGRHGDNAENQGQKHQHSHHSALRGGFLCLHIGID